VDVHDGVFSDWCELNFTDGVPEEAKADLKQDYDAINRSEGIHSAAVARRAGIADFRSVTFVPSVIAEFDSFWNSVSD
jgi:hypothetical protein